MADIDYDDYGMAISEGRGAHGRLQAILNISGAVISLSMLLGLGYWGYSIAVRDVTGIPVLRAMSEPMRVSPADPGGDSASHQGLTVNAVAAVGAVSELPDQLVLAPAPITLTEEDAPGMGAVVSSEALLLAAMPEEEATVETAKSTVDLLEPIEIAVAGEAVLDEAQSDAVAAALAVALAEEDITADIGEAGLTSSPRPKPRGNGSADLALAEPADVQSLSTEGGTADIREIAASDIPVGTRLVQLGAFDDGDAARREWLRLSGQFGELMSDKSMVVQEAQSGGRVFFRLRAHGFDGEDQARRFCAAILAEGASCIPVAQR
jgi:hypothetical protein